MSPQIDGPRRLQAGEFREAMALVEDCFDRAPGELEARMPHCFDASHSARHAVITVDGTIVSHVVCVPADLRAGDARIACGGFAGVATHPNHRGQGYMTRLIAYWLEELAAAGVPLAELEGDRVRYGAFGWENAGRELRVRVTRRSFDVGAGNAASAIDSDAIRPYDGTEDDLGDIRRIHERERYRVDRDRNRYRALLGQRGLETYLYDGAAPAYLAYRGDDPAAVLEFGGSRIGVVTLLDRLLGEVEETVIFTHPHHDRVPLLVDCALEWRAIPHRNLNLLDLHSVLDAFEPLLSERWRNVEDALEAKAGTVTLAVSDDLPPAGTNTEAVRLTYDAQGVRVSTTDADPDITHDRRAMTRLLFGDPDANRTTKRSHPFLAAVLPLEYYFWRTETI